MVDIPSSLVNEVAERIGVDRDTVVFNGHRTLGPTGCFIVTGFSTDAMVPGYHYAVLADDEWVAGGAADAVATVLIACFEPSKPDLTLDDWIDLIRRLDATPGKLAVVDEAGSYSITNRGGEWRPPSLETSGDTHQIRFQAVEFDFGDPFEVTATWDSQVFTSDYKPLGQ